MTTNQPDKPSPAEPLKCPFGNHPIFTYPSGRIVPHYDANGERCEGSYKAFAALPTAEPQPGEGIEGLLTFDAHKFVKSFYQLRLGLSGTRLDGREILVSDIDMAIAEAAFEVGVAALRQSPTPSKGVHTTADDQGASTIGAALRSQAGEPPTLELAQITLSRLEEQAQKWGQEIDIDGYAERIVGSKEKIRAMLEQCFIEGAYRTVLLAKEDLERKVRK